MAKEQPEILGKNWTKEVGSWKAETNIRNEFYQKVAGLKLGVSTDLDEVVKHPESKGLKTQEELNGKEDFKYRVKEGKNERLYNILDAYFKKIDISPADREKEIAISLYCLTRQGVNVDLVVPSWKVEVKTGQLFITKSTGETAVDGAFLRSIPGVTDKEEVKPILGGGWGASGGLPPGYTPKKAEEGRTPIPELPKEKPAPTAPKNNKSDILKKFKF